MLLSIITPSFNRLPFLRHTMDSILSQQGPFTLEWIVIDGGSSDGTVDFLRDAASRDPRIRFTTEPDRNQSDALNKGLSRATGDVVAWLNSDDLYLSGALIAVAEAFTNNANAQWLVGRCQNIDEAGQVIRPRVMQYKDRFLRRYTYRALLRENFINQPAVFWRRPFGQQIGLLDESLHYTMDYDLWLRMGRATDPLILDREISQFRIHPQSKSGAVNREQFDEQYRVACRYIGTDRLSRFVHRFNVEKIVWAYRFLRMIRR